VGPEGKKFDDASPPVMAEAGKISITLHSVRTRGGGDRSRSGNAPNEKPETTREKEGKAIQLSTKLHSSRSTRGKAKAQHNKGPLKTVIRPKGKRRQ